MHTCMGTCVPSRPPPGERNRSRCDMPRPEGVLTSPGVWLLGLRLRPSFPARMELDTLIPDERRIVGCARRLRAAQASERR
jgi:hypothetical protein